MNIDAKRGTRVKCDNLDVDVAQWGNNDYPAGILEIGKTYTVDHTEIHSQHTKVVLQEFPDKKFNTAHFE